MIKINEFYSSLPKNIEEIRNYIKSFDTINSKMEFSDCETVPIDVTLKLDSLISRGLISRGRFKDLFRVERISKDKKNGTWFFIEFSCKKCSKCFKKKLRITEIYKIFFHQEGHQDILCTNCSDSDDEIKRKQQIIAQNKEEQKLKDEQIEKKRWEGIMSPEHSWNKDTNMRSNFWSTQGQPEWTIDYLKNMPYGDFLKTPYWKAVSYEIKRKFRFKCALCNKNTLLATHHRTYKNHGAEVSNLNDLICLCNDCHSVHHTEKLKT